MHKYDLSICLPAIRPDYWERLYASFEAACSRYSFELILIGPYDLPEPLKEKDNIKYIKSYATSVRCAQESVLSAEGRMMAIPCDDGIAFPDSLNQSIDLYNASGPKDVVVLRYRECKGMKGKPLPMEYWYARHHPVLRSMNIPHEYKHAMQFLMSIEYYKEIGGYDCRFDHMAFAGHDLSYRIQRDGGILHLSPVEVMNADWFKGAYRDHGPIAASHEDHDLPLFREIQNSPKVGKRTKIDFDNWKDAPEVWARRWPNGIPA